MVLKWPVGNDSKVYFALGSLIDLPGCGFIISEGDHDWTPMSHYTDQIMLVIKCVCEFLLEALDCRVLADVITAIEMAKGKKKRVSERPCPAS